MTWPCLQLIRAYSCACEFVLGSTHCTVEVAEDIGYSCIPDAYGVHGVCILPVVVSQLVAAKDKKGVAAFSAILCTDAVVWLVFSNEGTGEHLRPINTGRGARCGLPALRMQVPRSWG